MSRYRIAALVLLGVAGVVDLAAARGEQPVRVAAKGEIDEMRLAVDVADEANRVLGLERSKAIRIGLPERVDRAGRYMIRMADGTGLEIELEPHSIRGDRFEVRLMRGERDYVLFDPGPATTVRGRVVGEADRTIAGSVERGVFRGVIRDADGGRIFIEPVWGRSQAADIDHHVMYDEDDVIPNGGVCVALGEQVGHRHDGARGGGTITECAELVCVVDLAVDADFDYLLAWGDEAATVQQIERVINTVNQQYEADISIRHALQTVLIRTEPFYRVTDAVRLLTTLRAKWLSNHGDIDRGITHMFTGKEIDSNIIGIAWLGAICDRNIGYGLSQSDCCGTFAAATDLTAHELGHNWNADHCDCVGWTMNPFITVANRFHPEFTVDDIRRFRTGLNCLSSGLPTPTELPFFDDFESGLIDRGLWSTVRGAGVNTDGLFEPSGDFAANLDGAEQIATASLDTSTSMNLRFEYWWQREGLADAPEEGDDLFVEYLGPDGRNDWILLRQHLGDGPDIQGFRQETIELPSDAEHSGFRVRFRTVSEILDEDGRPQINDGFDDWFVDNVLIAGDPAVPQAFDLLFPDDGAVAVALPLRLRWGFSERSNLYVVEVSESESFVPIAYRNTIEHTNILIDDELDPDTRYYWRVTSSNPRGMFETETGTFVTTLGLPQAFEAVTPGLNGSVTARRPLLTWSASEDAERYDLVVARDSEFTDPVVTHFQFASAGASTESYLMAGELLTNSTAYFWKMSATNIAGETAWSSGVRIFVTSWSCLGDVDGDGVVSVTDLSYVLARLHSADMTADANGDGIVDANDISFVLFRLGECG